jgi:hypothetical protein
VQLKDRAGEVIAAQALEPTDDPATLARWLLRQISPKTSSFNRPIYYPDTGIA